ncbi:hypothetical protein FIA58_020040 [Flavobacterium jejuense]|uniref:AsmA-like C-terminal domain-containing protein n=1 Tax=Flavobacterium jejuense TaxID=1544455 RepID=A0ABX0IXU6_9FLAO|nr:hypothetical protein [Flavobacterium jejuense]NHN27976.1 hypothetical protein [Flavobacterium jejuense]
MVKAHSLLYAVYVCLLVAIFCGGLLLLSNLYNQLNLYYVTHETLFISNQSTVNYALGNSLVTDESILTEEETGIQSQFSIKNHGLLPLLLTQSYVKNDTISSAHFVGQKVASTNIALYMANFTQPLSLSGDVTIKGNLFMPTDRIKESYINNRPNKISIQGNKTISEIQLPTLSDKCNSIFEIRNSYKTNFNAVDKKKDSIYVNSFFNETIEFQMSNTTLENKIIKGNFIVSSNDSIYIRKNNILEDVIIIAPKVAIESGFEGTIQVFAKESISIEKEVTLNYPSVIALYNNKEDQKAFAFIDEAFKIAGLVMLFGNDLVHLNKNTLEIKEKGKVMGNIYCTGVLTLKSDVYGAVYTSKLNHKTLSSSYSNTIADVTIDITKKPKVFIDMPIFNNKNNRYAIIKKVL